MSPQFTEGDVGKRVVNANGEEIGMVSAVEHGTARVDPDPGITDTIKATLGWEDMDEDTYPLQEQAVDHIGDDEIRLQGDLSGVGGSTGTGRGTDTGTGTGTGTDTGTGTGTDTGTGTGTGTGRDTDRNTDI